MVFSIAILATIDSKSQLFSAFKIIVLGTYLPQEQLEEL